MIERKLISDGVVLVRSDKGLRIREVGTGREYSEATELPDSPKEWEEAETLSRRIV